MPKLPTAQAKKTAKADAWESGGGRQLLDDGRYAGQLFSVVEREGRKAPYWNWRFVNIHDIEGDPQGRVNLFLSTSLSEAAAGGLKQAFDAFGYTTDSDTDEIVGEWAVLYVRQEVQEQGKNAGQRVNVVSGLAPFDPDDWAFDPDEVPEYVERDRFDAGASSGRRGSEDAF